MRIKTTQTTKNYKLFCDGTTCVQSDLQFSKHRPFQTSTVGVTFSASLVCGVRCGKPFSQRSWQCWHDFRWYLQSFFKFKDNVINTFFDSFVAGRWLIYIHLLVWLSWISSVHDDFFSFFFPMTKESHIIMLAAEVNMQMVPPRRHKWSPTNWPRLDLCNFYQRPITVRKHEKNTKGAIFLHIFAEDYALWFWCLQNMFSSTVQPREHQEMRFVADQTCWPRSKCWPRERVDTRWPGEPCSMFS